MNEHFDLTEQYQPLVLKAKHLRDKVSELARTRDYNRMRPKTCFEIMGLESRFYTPITAQSFTMARLLWIRFSRICREQGDTKREVAINIAWQCLKGWICPVCGGPKNRTRAASCGAICGRKLSAAAIRDKKGPIILRFNVRQKEKPTGNQYQGNGLRRAQYDLLKHTLEKNNGNVAATARELKMGYGTMKYYIRKFGGYHHTIEELRKNSSAAATSAVARAKKCSHSQSQTSKPSPRSPSSVESKNNPESHLDGKPLPSHGAAVDSTAGHQTGGES